MNGGTHPSPVTAVAFPDSKKVPIYSWIDRESFPIIGWHDKTWAQSYDPPATLKFLTNSSDPDQTAPLGAA